MSILNRYTPIASALVFSFVISPFQVANAALKYGVSGYNVTKMEINGGNIFHKTTGRLWEQRTEAGEVTQEYRVVRTKKSYIILSNLNKTLYLKFDLTDSATDEDDVEGSYTTGPFNWTDSNNKLTGAWDD